MYQYLAGVDVDDPVVAPPPPPSSAAVPRLVPPMLGVDDTGDGNVLQLMQGHLAQSLLDELCK